MNNRILLVEDDQSFGAVLKDYLMMNNYEVTLAWRTGTKRIHGK